MERIPRPFCNALNHPKQVLVWLPHSIRKNQLAAGIFLLACGNRCNEVVGDWDAANVPLLRMPFKIWLVHDIQKPVLHVCVFRVGRLTIANPGFRNNPT